jgi:4-hydroxy-tetrahydrodipicolinate synthase
MHIAKNKPDSLALLSGDDPLTLPMLACGAKGVISVVANAYPETFSGMVRAALRGDWQKARELHFTLLDLYPWLFVDGNPAGVKAALETMGLCSKEVRLPLSTIQKDHFRLLKAEIQKIEQNEPVKT